MESGSVGKWLLGGSGRKGQKEDVVSGGGRMFIVARERRGDLAALLTARRFHGQARLF